VERRIIVCVVNEKKTIKVIDLVTGKENSSLGSYLCRYTKN
jgi:hypothetical protein